MAAKNKTKSQKHSLPKKLFLALGGSVLMGVLYVIFKGFKKKK